MRPEAKREDSWYERLGRGGAPLAVIIVVGIYLIYKLLFIVELIAVAALLALVVRTVLNRLERLGLPPWLSVIAILLGIVAFVASVWFIMIPNVLEEVQSFVTGGPGLRQKIQALISEGVDYLQGLPLVPNDFASQLPRQLEEAFSGLIGTLPDILPNSLPLLASTFESVLLGVVAVVFLTIYFAISPGTYIAIALRLMPADRHERARGFTDRLERKLRAWIVGTVLVALVMGVGAGIGLWILGIPLPLTFGVLVGVLSIIPFIGSALGGLFPGLLALTISPTKALMVGVLFLVLAQLDGNVLRPLIFGREIEMPPGVVLISILFLGVLLGPIIGVFLAIPVAVLIKVMVDELIGDKPVPEDEETT